MCFAPWQPALFRHLNCQKCSLRNNFFTFHFQMCFAPQGRALFRNRNFQNWSERVSFRHFLTSKSASRHSSLHFFNIAISKTGSRMVFFFYFLVENVLRGKNGVDFFSISTSKTCTIDDGGCFHNFYFQMCFAPQWRAIFHLSSGQLAPHPSL